MSEFNQHRHAMRVLRDLERQISPQAQTRAEPARNTRSRSPQQGGTRAPQSDPWTIPNIVGFENDGDWNPELLARNWVGIGREGVRQVTDAARPVGQVAGRAAGALSDSFNEWNANRERRDMIERDLAARYMPQIRAANAGTLETMQAEGDLRRREDALPQNYERSNAFLRSRLEPVIHPWAEVEPKAYPRIGGEGRRLPQPAAPYQAPETLSDDELYAEYEALNRGGPSR